MKRPARVPSQLSESLHKRLSAYALAASAAGVGALALTLPAEAKIIYTPANVEIDKPDVYYLNLNHDGIRDFRIRNSEGIFAGDGRTAPFKHPDNTYQRLSLSPMENGNQIWGTGASASALPSGVQVGANSRFKKSHRRMVGWGNWCVTGGSTCTHTSGGPWNNVENRYLGLKFIVKGKIHYGWARLNVKNGWGYIDATLTGYAYETIPNKPIITGKTHGKDAATLGRLAQGASGISDQGKP
jgi:hypothetical protein